MRLTKSLACCVSWLRFAITVAAVGPDGVAAPLRVGIAKAAGFRVGFGEAPPPLCALIRARTASMFCVPETILFVAPVITWLAKPSRRPGPATIS